MQNITTVVINCAGIGSRLGMGVPKSLIPINGQPLIYWQLKTLLQNIEDVRIVVGFRGNEVIRVVRELRTDVVFVINNEYARTQTGFSLGLGSKYAKEIVVSLDGDLLIHPDDWKNFINHSSEILCTCPVSSENPVCVILDQKKQVIGFTRETDKLEWTGLVKINSDKISQKLQNVFVYQLLESYLPMQHMIIRSCEIDTPGDYDKAGEWVSKNL
jgi:choline kinase